eukprot:8263607-Pyramimonas_sp.AAC.1
MERATEASSQWLRTPYGRARGNPLRSRRTRGPASTRSGASASERDMLHTVPMVISYSRIAMGADDDIFENMPLAQQHLC